MNPHSTGKIIHNSEKNKMRSNKLVDVVELFLEGVRVCLALKQIEQEEDKTKRLKKSRNILADEDGWPRC